MKKNSSLFAGFSVFFLAMVSSVYAQTGRTAWADVAPPSFVSISPSEDDPSRIAVVFTLVTGGDGADRGSVEMLDPSGAILDTKLVGRSKNDTRVIEFTPSKSGVYSFRINALRRGESQAKVSETRSFTYSFPLAIPSFSVLHDGKGSVLLKWASVWEAEKYELSVVDSATGKERVAETTRDTQGRISGLKVGSKYGFTVTALRGADRSRAQPIYKTLRQEADREWSFTWFGQSTKAELNTMRMIDADNVKFELRSCSFLSDGQIDQKGGKFTTFHDGVSYYYTVIDPRTENFELTATFTIDYINPTADGQEGFGLVAMDSLGEYGVSMQNHYTNSASIIATKFEEVIAGVKRTSKDTLGARFVSGITKEVLAQGDTGIATHGLNVSHAYSYDRVDLVEAGDVYRLTLKKSNTGYHAILRDENAADDAVTEYIMYGVDKLLQLDPDHVYVGFAVARGCNATVSDVSMVVTDPKTDPPAMEEPPELIPTRGQVDSPVTFTEKNYPFVFRANADGRITITDRKGKVIEKNAPVVANTDFFRTYRLVDGVNEFNVVFAPDPDYRPGKNQIMATYDRELAQYVPSSQPISINHSVMYFFYDRPELYVSPGGSFLGKGSKEDPLDLDTALFFAKAGQPIILAGGIYHPMRGVVIPRRNDGTKDNRKVLKSASGERAVFDFSSSPLGMQLWGDYWTIDGIDVRNTPDNVKGLQVAGDENILANINTYNCGDTGLQISGTSTEPFKMWPKNNVVLNCTSHDNCDPAANNADGFAAKLTCGEGNVFRGCVAYSNIDDGWDLFAKIESGPIGAVLIENCVAYKNGSLSDGSGNGDGNGFKLGGDGIAVPHVLSNCVAFANGASGITSNSDPAIIVEGNTSFGNKGPNINLYGKGDGTRSFKASNNISMNGGSADVYREMPELASPRNYFWDGARSVNSEGRRLGSDIFVNIDMNVVPGRKRDGSIDMKGLLVLTDAAPRGVGATLK